MHVRHRHRTIAGACAAILLAVTACSSGDNTDVADPDADTSAEPSATAAETTDATDPTSPAADDEPANVPVSTTIPGPTGPATTSPRAEVTSFQIDPDTDELIEVTETEPGPTTWGEVVDAGIAAGLWDELEGVTRMLGYAVGAVPLDQVPGADEVIDGDLRGLLMRANGFALSGEYGDDELAGLRRWYELAVPSSDALEMLEATSAPGTAAVQGFRAVRTAAGCAPVDPEDFSNWAVVEGCYKVLEETVGSATLRVYYPDWYEADEVLAQAPLMALDALVLSIQTFSGFAPVGDVDVVFSLVDTVPSTNVYAVATVDSQWGTASIAGACPVTVFPFGVSQGSRFRQTMAHELWHCVQRESGYTPGVPAGTKWFVEGGAVYFSNVVYPQTNMERARLPRFDRSSRTTPLFDMGYEAFIWWQFLGNREGPAAIADMHLRIDRAGDFGRAAMQVYGREFQAFVVDFMAGKISDEGVGFFDRGVRLNAPSRKVDKNSQGDTIDFEVEPFVAGRYWIEYDKQLRVLETDQTETVGEVAMAKWDERLDPNKWREVFPEVRSKCRQKVDYILVATTHVGSHKAKIRIDTTEQAVCDPCLIGTWDLQLDTFKEMIVGAAGESFPPGMSFDLSGHYYLSMDDEGALQEQRDGLVITVGAEGFSFDMTIRSYATGRYTADGENMSVLDRVEDYVTVTSSLSGPTPAFSDAGVFSDDGSGTYVCDNDVLTVTAVGFPPITWDRVDKILQPDITVPA